MNGPQKGWRRRTNPVHTMLDTGVDAERGNQGFPHGLGGADDVIFMPLQASTQWDGLGHIFDHGKAWNGRRAGDVVTSEGDLVTGIETATGRISGRGVLLDVGRAIGEDGELPDGFAITAEHLEATIAAQGASSAVGRGDLLLVRTGRLARARARRAGAITPAARHPGCRSPPPTGCTRSEIAGDRHRHLGFRGPAERVRQRLPAAAPGRHPAHGPVHRRDVGPGRTGRRLRGRRRLRVLAVRRTPAGHRRGRRPRHPRRHQVSAEPWSHARQSENVLRGRRRRSPAPRPRSCSPRAGVAVDLVEIKPELSALGSGITLQGNALRVLRQLGVWDGVASRRATPFDTPRPAGPGPGRARSIAELDDVRTGGPDLPATVGMYRARAGPDPARPGRPRPARRCGSAPPSTALDQDEDGVDVTFADGSTGRYDLVVGADGIRSWTRAGDRHRRSRPGRRAWASGGRSRPRPRA